MEKLKLVLSLFLFFILGQQSFSQNKEVVLRGKKYEVANHDKKKRITLYDRGAFSKDKKKHLRESCAYWLNVSGWLSAAAAVFSSPAAISVLLDQPHLIPASLLLSGQTAITMLYRNKSRNKILEMMNKTYSWLRNSKAYTIPPGELSSYVRINRLNQLYMTSDGMDKVIRKFILDQKRIMTSEKVFYTGMSFDTHLNIEDFIGKEVLIKEYEIFQDFGKQSNNPFENISKHLQVSIPHERGSTVYSGVLREVNLDVGYAYIEDIEGVVHEITLKKKGRLWFEKFFYSIKEVPFFKLNNYVFPVYESKSSKAIVGEKVILRVYKGYGEKPEKIIGNVISHENYKLKVRDSLSESETFKEVDLKEFAVHLEWVEPNSLRKSEVIAENYSREETLMLGGNEEFLDLSVNPYAHFFEKIPEGVVVSRDHF